MNLSNPDLTQFPPRSPRVRLGGLILLPRMLDKCRATLAGTNGPYNYACPLDQYLLQFLGIDADALKAEVAKGLNDGALLEWIMAHSTTQPSPQEIAAWSAYQEQRAPGALEIREFFNTLHQGAAPHRADIVTWCDLLDVDDYASFGGKP